MDGYHETTLRYFFKVVNSFHQGTRQDRQSASPLQPADSSSATQQMLIIRIYWSNDFGQLRVEFLGLGINGSVILGGGGVQFHC